VAAGKRCGMKVQAALRAVREIEVVGQTLVLRFSHTFSRDMVGQAENRGQIEAIWEELLGRKIQVRCALVGEAAAPPQAAASPVSHEADEDAFLQDARNLGAVVKRIN
jgi:hypothetical protein